MNTNLIAWYFYGLFGLGGWVIFLLLALAAVFYIWYDSSNRKLQALGWRVGALILACLLIPSFLYRFTVTLIQFNTYISCITPVVSGGFGYTPDACVNGGPGGVLPPPPALSPPLAPYYEIIFYLGLVGGLLAVAVAVAYFINFQGVSPAISRQVYPPIQPPFPSPYIPSRREPQMPRQEPLPPVAPSRPKKPLTHAWLVARDGRSHQLCAGETTIGRSADNDIYITGDTTLSKQHAKIVEQNDHFRIIDLGSTNGTRVNGNWLRQPILLEPDDEVQFGDHTLMRFVTSRS